MMPFLESSTHTSNLITEVSNNSDYTATEDCFCVYNLTCSGNSHAYGYINGKEILQLFGGATTTIIYSPIRIKKGDIIKAVGGGGYTGIAYIYGCR